MQRKKYTSSLYYFNKESIFEAYFLYIFPTVGVYLKYTSKVDLKYTSVYILKNMFMGKVYFKYTLNVYFRHTSVEILKNYLHRGKHTWTTLRMHTLNVLW